MAEVLVTLGIIGVVAALTMPVLMAHHQKQQTVVKLKKACSEIAQAFKLAELEYGSVSSWEFGTAFDGPSAENFANKYLIPYMNVVKNCGASTGCLGGEVYALSNTSETFGQYGDSSTHTAKFIVNSGYGIGITSGNQSVNVQIVINNNKNKLIMGKDIFFFSLNKNTGIFPYTDSSQDREDYYINDENYGCSKDAGDAAGMRCGSLIVRDGWQIAPDYPW